MADDRGLDFDEEVSKRHLDDDSANFNQNISQTVQRYLKKQGIAGHTFAFNYIKYSILWRHWLLTEAKLEYLAGNLKKVLKSNS